MQQDGGRTLTIQRINHTTSQIMRMVSRVTNRHHGMKDDDVIKLVQALVVSRVVYCTPYLPLKPRELNQLDIILRKAYKQVLGLPPHTACSKMEALGVHNKMREIVDAHLVSQLERLRQTSSGRRVLRQIGYQIADASHPRPQTVPQEIRTLIRVAPLPRNMHPQHHVQRRQPRVQLLLRKYPAHPHVRFTDAAHYATHPATAVSVIDGSGDVVCTATVQTKNIAEAEEAATALAMTSATWNKPLHVITNCRQACRNYGNGHISTSALRLLEKHKDTLNPNILIWTPGHAGLDGNERAHATARVCTLQAPH
ncbi:hypothetical protein HPB48_012069 [Haemaphysalis longicornis]|uniref:Tick transposon n=1 Tax=Haemaphysalis longicornis TaxID=44386 RepID=A0A9J6GW93_HAELO|nr:hypothetical protein HPB48_012069 [Haemaphysalis longicornis]